MTSCVRSSRTHGLERVDAGPERGVAEVGLLGDLDQALAGQHRLIDWHGVLEVAEQDVGLLGHVWDLRRHLLVRGVEEMDHPGGLEGDLARGSGASIARGWKKSRGFLMVSWVVVVGLER